MQITINGRNIEAAEGSTILQTARREGIGIPVVCLALVEDSDKRREVRPMCADACGGIDFAEECSNYVGLSMG